MIETKIWVFARQACQCKRLYSFEGMRHTGIIYGSRKVTAKGFPVINCEKCGTPWRTFARRRAE